MPTSPSAISALATRRRHLLLTAEDESTVSRFATMIVQTDPRIGIISEEVPFLANLSALENIVLGCMYHKALSLQSCLEGVRDVVNALGLSENLDLRPQLLSRPMLLKMHLVRCIANDASVVFLPRISRPDCDILHRAVDSLDRDVFLWVACLSNDQDVYTSLEYPIIDLNSLQ